MRRDGSLKRRLVAAGDVQTGAEGRHHVDAGFAGELTGKPGIDMVAPFGTSLHVSGRDQGQLEASIAPYRNSGNLHWQKSAPSLEDVFIDLMNRAKDNFQ